MAEKGKNVRKKEIKSTSRFFSGVVALTLANIFVKVVGLLLKIPLRSILGDSGMAYYNNAYDIYAFFFTVSTVGLPTALSMLISENRAKGNKRETKKIFRVTAILFVIIGIVGSCAMFFGAPLFEDAYKIENSAYCIMAVAPTLFFICVASALRGYFQGYQNMVPTAVSEVIEAVGKMALGLLFADYARAQGQPVHIIASYAALGLTIGIAAGMLFLIIRKLLFKPASYDVEYGDLNDETLPVRSTGTIIKTLIFIAVPITLSSSVMSFSTMLDGIILSRGLQDIGFSENSVKEMIGNYKTCAVPISHIILALVAPITAAIIPLISSTNASGNKSRVEKIFNSTLKISMILILPCILGIAVLAEPIIAFLFNDMSAAYQAGPLLSVLAISIFFMSMIQISAAVLQSHKYQRKPIISVAVGCLTKVVATYILVTIPSLNIMGSPISSIISSFVISFMNFYFIKKHIGFSPNFIKLTVRPLIASIACAISAAGVYALLNGVLGLSAALFTSVGAAAVVYVVMIFVIKALDKEELELIPKGKALVRVLNKIGLMK